MLFGLNLWNIEAERLGYATGIKIDFEEYNVGNR